MNGSAPDIMSLLLGAVPSMSEAGRAIVPASSDGPAFGSVFGNMLRAQLNPIVNSSVAAPSQVPTSADSPDVSSLPTGQNGQSIGEPVLPTNDNAGGATQESPASPSLTASSVWDILAVESNLPANSAPSGQVAMESPTAEAVQVSPMVSTETLPAYAPSSPVLEQAPLFVMLRGSVTANESLNDIISGRTAEPGTGSYKVIDWTLSGDTVHLDVIPEDADLPVMRISLPAARLLASADAITSPIVATQPRVTVDQHLTDEILTASRLEKLNIRQLQIELDNSSQNQSNALGRAEVKLIAENAGQEIAIKANIRKNSIRVKTSSGRRPDALVLKSGDKADSGRLRPGGAVEVPSLDATRRNSILTERSLMDNLGLATRNETGSLDLASPETTTGSDRAVTGLARPQMEQGFARESLAPQPVRLSLPDDARVTLRPNGHAVRLRLDPEQLGPARLSLILNEGHLRASVVVESHQAKAAVEHSLDRLIDSLAKADIKVDSIEVSVDQQGTREQLFGRSQPWHHVTKRSINETITKTDSPDAAATGAIPAALVEAHVGAGGVNLLA